LPHTGYAVNGNINWNNGILTSVELSCCTPTSLPGRRPLPRVWQHSALSVVSWHCDLHGAANTQQLLRQNFTAVGPRLWNSQSIHHLQIVQTTAEGTLFTGTMNTDTVTSDMLAP